MYLTRFRFNTARTRARQLLARPQAMHAGVMCCFGDLTAPSPPGGPRPLWRVDRKSRSEVHMYLVSPERPDLTHLVEQAGWPATDAGWQTREYAPFLARLQEGGTWAFRLTANPVHSVRRKDGEPTKRTAHITPRHQIDWLLKRQENAGFEIMKGESGSGAWQPQDAWQVSVGDQRHLDFSKQAGAGERRRRVTLTTVVFDGRLRVTDPDALRRTLTAGLGKAKAYGCGLMTLAPTNLE